jgi:pantoate--beta-alanine ligase
VQILHTAAEVKARLRPLQAQGIKVGLVPTMGALHEGHLSLVRQLAPDVEVVAASIFVNPMQFGPKEDLAKYPRDLAGDAAKLASVGCHLVYAPDAIDVYPPGFQTAVEVSEVSQGLCGAVRPGHFRGVTTVVMKLFQVVRPDIAIFGEKDFQQLTVLRQMASDLALDVEVRGAPLVRDPDGLAMSSRNAYLSPEERARALSISRGLGAARAAYEGGERDGAVLLGLVRASLEVAALTPEYLELRSFRELRALERAEGPCVVLVATRVGGTRLIDNVILRRG